MSLAEIELFAGQTVEILTPTGYPTRRVGEITAVLENGLFHVLETGKSRVTTLPRERLRVVWDDTGLSVPASFVSSTSDFSSGSSAGGSRPSNPGISNQQLLDLINQAVAEWVATGPLSVFAPKVAVQPVPKSLTVGQTLSLEVVAGTVPNTQLTVAYQWQRSTGAGGYTDIVGATSSVYEKPNAQPGDAGFYRCVLSNLLGSVITNSVEVTIV